MKKSDVLFHLFLLAVIAGALVGCIALGAWLFNVIIESDLPAWVKYMLLKN